VARQLRVLSRMVTIYILSSLDQDLVASQ